MNRTEFWTVTVSHWGVLPEGVRPGVNYGYGDWPAGSYRPNDFHFAKPPSRQEFIDACMGHLPWTHVWKDDLFPLMAANDWPMVDWMHKAASVDLEDEAGNVVGSVRIARDSTFDNKGYDRHAIAIPCEVENAIVNRLPKEKRSDADMVLMRAENRIQETLLKLDDVTDDKIKAELRKHLKAAGFIKGKATA